MLQKQTITIPLGLGVNTKADEKLVEQGAFNLVCENATFEKVGAVKKRGSYNDFSDTYYLYGSANGTSGNVSSLTYPAVCAAALGKQIFLKNKVGDYLYSHDGAFIYNNENKIPEVKVSSQRVYSTTSSIDVTDTQYDSDEGILAVVVRDGFILSNSDGGSQIILYDVENKTCAYGVYIPNALGANRFGFVKSGLTRVSGVSYYYHASVNSNNVLFIQPYNKYGQVYLTSFAQTNILADGTATTDKGPIAGCRSSSGDTFYFIVPTTTANTGRIIGLSGTTTVFNSTFTYTGTGWKSASAIFNPANSTIKFCYVTDSNTAREIVFNNSGVVAVSDAALAGATSVIHVSYDQDNVNRILMNTSTNFCVYSGGSLSVANMVTNAFSDKVTVNNVDCVVTIDELGSETYVAMGLSPNNDSGASAFARLDTGVARQVANQMTRLSKIGDTKVVAALPRLSSDNGDYRTYNLQLTTFEIHPDYKSHSRTILGNNLHFSGGLLTEFDGKKINENGFLIRPKAPSLVHTASGSLTGTYRYIIVLKKYDSNGQVTRSEPSLIATTGAMTSKQVDISIPVMPFGLNARECFAEIYRNLNGGSTFYFLKEVPVNMYAQTSGIVTGSSIPDNTSDAVIQNNGTLYTTGGVLANDPAPSSKSAIQGGNRMFLIGLEDENEAAYSKKKLLNESVSFSDLFRIRFDSAQFNTTGGLTAQGYMDDKYIVFKRNSIFFVSGDGPNELGLNDTFSPPELISSDTGCTDPRSVILTPLGLMFKGEKGIYLLNRGLSTEYIGAGVEAYNQYNISSAVHLDKKNQVIFTLVGDDNATNKFQLVYDYFTQQWSVYTGYACLDSDILDGSHLILDANSNIPLIQSGNTYLDNSSGYAMKVTTPWVKIGGIQDFGRIWKALIVGKYKSEHQLIIKAYYDYNETYFETFTISPSASDAQYQYECKMVKQKCEAIKFEIYDSSITGESMELTALTLEVGVRKGAMKLPASRKH